MHQQVNINTAYHVPVNSDLVTLESQLNKVKVTSKIDTGLRKQRIGT